MKKKIQVKKKKNLTIFKSLGTSEIKYIKNFMD